MSERTDRISTHVIWTHLPRLGTAIDEASSMAETVPDGIEELERLRAALTFIGKRLAGTDRQLLPSPSLDILATHVDAARGETAAFVSEGARARLTNANAHIDAALAVLPALNYPAVSDDFQALNEAAGNYRAALESNLERARASMASFELQVATARADVGRLTENVTTEQTRLTTLTTEFQNQFSTAQATRQTDFANTQAKATERFSVLLEEYRSKLEGQTADFVLAFQGTARDYAGHMDSLRNEFEYEATRILKDIKDKQLQVEKLVGVIGNLGVTSGYLVTANSAQRATRLWQVFTVVAMFGLIGGGYYAFVHTIQTGFTWPTLAGRVVFTLTVGVLAAYSGAQADRYAEVERRNRKLALELEAIGPYLAPLSPDKQEMMREKLADRTFGRADAMLGRRGRSPATVVDVLRSRGLRQLIATIIRESSRRN